MERRRTRKVKVGDICVGGDAKIAVQSMTNTDTRDVEATVGQILKLEAAGCDIVRCAVPDMEAAEAIKEIVSRVNIPVVADPTVEREREKLELEGEVSKVFGNDQGCRFKDRCRYAREVCSKETPELRKVADNHFVACHLC